jgi:hypothetical protein
VPESVSTLHSSAAQNKGGCSSIDAAGAAYGDVPMHLLHRTKLHLLANVAAFTHNFDSIYSRGRHDCAVQVLAIRFDTHNGNFIFDAFHRR